MPQSALVTRNGPVIKVTARPSRIHNAADDTPAETES